jgi:hypothetical protein
MGRNQTTFRDPMRTNWESYRDDLRVNLKPLLHNICVIRDVDGNVELL